MRPGHIFEGTKGDNAADRDAKGRTTKGERSGVAKLTEAQVREIRARHAAGETQAALEREFGVRPGTVWPIVHGLAWKATLQ